MKKEYQDIISGYLGVKPIQLNSSLVSAQSRKRLYWTNITGYTPPEDKGILLKGIVHEHTDFKPLGDAKIDRVLNSPRGKGYFLNPATDAKSSTVIAGYHKEPTDVDYPFQKLNEFIVPFDKTLQILDKEVARGKVGYFRKDSQANRVYYTIHGQNIEILTPSSTTQNITTLNPKKADGSQTYQQDRIYTTDGKMVCLSAELQGRYNIIVPDGHLFGCITPDRVDKRQNGQKFNDGTKFYTLTAQDRHGILIEGYIRKLTPIECERLQTLPDNYTAGVSNSQRYKMLGNGWTVDAVCEFFKHIPVNALDLF